MSEKTMKVIIHACIATFILCVFGAIFGTYSEMANLYVNANNELRDQKQIIKEKDTEIEQLNERIDELEGNSLTSLGVFQITAYGCDCEGCTGVTKSGNTPAIGRTVAVDPEVIPLGSTIIIDGHEYIAEDIGGAIKGNMIDMYVGTEELSKFYGVKYKEVFMKEENRK